jgi:hypothetical protein
MPLPESPATRQSAPEMATALAEDGTSRVLDPIDRVSEVLFGLFMVLTFTGTLSVLDSGRA